MFMKQLPYFFFLPVDTGQDDMAGGLIGQLDNALAKIGVYHFHAVLFQEIVEMAFLGEHRLTFYHLVLLMMPENGEDDVIVFSRVGRPMDDDAVAGGFFFKLPEVFAEIGQDIVLDL